MSAAGRRAEYEQLLADIAAGVELHYGAATEDPDFALLEGDRLYARGLQSLAELGDLEATARLADAISEVAAAHAAGDPGLAGRAWEAAAGDVRASGALRLHSPTAR